MRLTSAAHIVHFVKAFQSKQATFNWDLRVINVASDSAEQPRDLLTFMLGYLFLHGQREQKTARGRLPGSDARPTTALHQHFQPTKGLLAFAATR